MGEFDSSKTRVGPVFEALVRQPGGWLRRLLQLPKHGHPGAKLGDALDLTYVSGKWTPNEKALPAPVALLSYLIRNFSGDADGQGDGTAGKRAALARREPAVIEEALALLRRDPGPKGWHILEGPTCPDAFVLTRDAVIVVEGKRTESGPTTHTTWMPGRHQMLRHIDAAWEIRGARHVYGLFIVESGDAGTPDTWAEAARETVSDAALDASLPHRSSREREAITSAFLGVTTWQDICREFQLSPSVLLERVPVGDGAQAGGQ
jgi:hypothetical protein